MGTELERHRSWHWANYESLSAAGRAAIAALKKRWGQQEGRSKDNSSAEGMPKRFSRSSLSYHYAITGIARPFVSTSAYLGGPVAVIDKSHCLRGHELQADNRLPTRRAVGGE